MLLDGRKNNPGIRRNEGEEGEKKGKKRREWEEKANGISTSIIIDGSKIAIK